MAPQGIRLEVIAGLALVAGLSACGTANPPQAVVSSPTPTSEPTRHPRPGDVATPAPVTSGPLTARDMPKPEVFGSGWRHYVAVGSADSEGFAPNNSWVWGRDPQDAVVTLLPIGCQKARPAVVPPAPVAALSANYANAQGLRADATTFEFTNAQEAKRFVQDFALIEDACGKPPTGTLNPENTYTKDGSLNQRTQVYTDVRYTAGLIMNQRIAVVGNRVVFTAAPLSSR